MNKIYKTEGGYKNIIFTRKLNENGEDKRQNPKKA